MAPAAMRLFDHVVGLLRGAALAVDGGGRHFVGQAIEQPSGAGDVEALLAGLGHTAAHDLLDQAGIDAGALDHLDLGGAQNVGGPQSRQATRCACQWGCELLRQ